MDYLKLELLNNLPSARDVRIPDFITETTMQEKKLLGLTEDEIENGKEELTEAYKMFKLNRSLELTEPLYSNLARYIAYLIDYAPKYYPRIYLILNQLLRYTKFFEILNSWNGSQIDILDIGAGNANMSFSLIEYLEFISKLGAYDFNYYLKVIEKEINFLNYIQRAYKNLDKVNKTLYSKITLDDPLTTLDIDFDNPEKSLYQRLKGKKYHIIIISFILNENNPTLEKTIRFFRIVSNYLFENGIIVFLGASSHYLFEYFEIDFKKEMNLNRIAPCMNGNRIYSTPGSKDCPFFKPCGDFCSFQITDEERHKFTYLVLSKEDLEIKKYENEIQSSIDFYEAHYLDQFKKSWEKETGDICNIIGVFVNKEFRRDKSDNQHKYDYYFCNGACKLKIDKLEPPPLNINEGDIVYFKNVIYDGLYPKINWAYRDKIEKNYVEIPYKFNRESIDGIRSEYEVIENFHNYLT